MSPLTVRPPAVPLITHDPYFSGWSFSDQLTDSDTRHWTGSSYGLISLVCVDGTTYRLMGTRRFGKSGWRALPVKRVSNV